MFLKCVAVASDVIRCVFPRHDGSANEEIPRLGFVSASQDCSPAGIGILRESCEEQTLGQEVSI